MKFLESTVTNVFCDLDQVTRLLSRPKHLIWVESLPHKGCHRCIYSLKKSEGIVYSITEDTKFSGYMHITPHYIHMSKQMKICQNLPKIWSESIHKCFITLLAANTSANMISTSVSTIWRAEAHLKWQYIYCKFKQSILIGPC